MKLVLTNYTLEEISYFVNKHSRVLVWLKLLVKFIMLRYFKKLLELTWISVNLSCVFLSSFPVAAG